MKSGLWVVIVLVTGIVGFLVGYSVSSYTGFRHLSEAQASEGGEPSKAAAPAAAESSGYGGSAKQPAAAGGYGGAEKPAPKPPPAKRPAAGY